MRILIGEFVNEGMNRKVRFNSWKPFINLFLSFLFLTPSLHAEMNSMEMKGVHELIHSDYEYLSPVYGLTLLATRTLENRRFYGNYGPKKEGFGCLEKASRIHELLASNQDCPQDHTSELIQRLFPSQDRVNFVANQIDSDPVSHLKAETLGKVLGRISQVEDSDLTSSEKVKKLTEDLNALLFEGLHPKKYHEKRILELKAEQKRKDCTPEEKSKLTDQISSIQEVLKSYTSAENPSNGNSPSTSVGKDKDFEEVARLIVEALKESRLAPEKYPKHLPEQTLLSFFWKKGNEKKDYLALLQGMSQLNPRVLRNT